jgi:hypothetical protein
MEQTTTQTCPNCHTQNAPQNIFCQACGTRLNPAAQSTPDSQPRSFEWSQATSSQPLSETYPRIMQPATQYGMIQIDRLGSRLDGWADLVEGAAEKAEEIRMAFDGELQDRHMPQIDQIQSQLTPGGLAGKRRKYYLTQNPVGATLATYIGEFGHDLYISWDLFVRPVIKWRNLAIMVGIAALLAICPALVSQSISDAPLVALVSWFFSTLGWLVPVVIVALIAGRFMRGSFLAFFIEEIDHFAADDVTAMMFAVHKSLLKAVDSVGLDASTLRPKERYTGGRRERII